MEAADFKFKLIDTYQDLLRSLSQTDNEDLLEEALRLLRLESEDIEVYKLSDEQRSAVYEAREQIKRDDF